MLRKFYNWIIRFFSKSKGKPIEAIDFNFEYVADVPNDLKENILYFVGEQNYYWQVVMICPCGCKAMLYMNLITDYEPHWKFSIVNKRVSLSPSIHRMVGCKSHFFIKNGKLIWA
ncbi:DUF6527 family protein [Flavobacterium mekongense]|uniref:DUF6527 family protein n=1 Tax=Flavobacterium mekongense TaxID=3379707 RepID=UPI003999CA09